MVVIAGFDRDDPNYLARLEDEFCRLKKKEEIEQKPLTVDPTNMDNIMQALSGITDQIKDMQVFIRFFQQ